jgi:hypothetical protein
MFRRAGLLMVLVLVMSVFLAACGDETATIPTYSGASAVTLPDTIKSQFTASAGSVKNPKVEAFKSSDEAAKIKSGLVDGFKKNGWTDKTDEAMKSAGDSFKQLEGMGAFVIGFEKGSSAAVVMGLPGSLAGALSISGVEQKDTLYMVFSGSNK